MRDDVLFDIEQLSKDVFRTPDARREFDDAIAESELGDDTRRPSAALVDRRPWVWTVTSTDCSDRDFNARQRERAAPCPRALLWFLLRPNAAADEQPGWPRRAREQPLLTNRGTEPDFTQSEYCIVILSRHYERKLWTRHELKQAQARAFRENREYLLPVRLDDTAIPGVSETVGYIDIRWDGLDAVVQAVLPKLGSSQHP